MDQGARGDGAEHASSDVGTSAHRDLTATRAACARLLRVLGVDGLSVSLVSGRHRELVHATDVTVRTLEEAQLVLGEGPTVDAVRDGALVALVDPGEVGLRWPGFAAECSATAARSVAAVPLAAGGIAFGVLTAYRRTDERAALSATPQLAVLLGELAATVLDDLVGLDELVPTDATPEPVFGRREVHLASGMVAVQLGVGVPEALDRLRALAYTQHRTLRAVATDVLERRLVLRADRD